MILPLLALLSADPVADPAREPVPLELALHQTTGARFHPDTHATLFFDGEVFGEIQTAIAQARTSVDIVLYIWRPGEPSGAITAALEQARHRHIACRVLVDPVGSTPEFQEQVQPRLQAAGCDVRLFRPLDGSAGKGSRLARNHRKMVIVDGAVAFTGGFGFSPEWVGGRDRQRAWRDTAIRIRGAAVDEMQVAFAQDWDDAEGPRLRAVDFPGALETGGEGEPTRATFIASVGRMGSTNADRLSRVIFGEAKQRLWIANAYFVPSEPLLDLLERQARAGVDVRLLLPNDLDDSQVALNRQRALYDRLLQAGVRIWEFQPAMMHAKTMVLDRGVVVVGSANLDPLSLNLLEEGCVVAESGALNQQLAARFEKDLDSAQEIKPGAREIPGFWRRIRNRLPSLSGHGPETD